MKIIAAIIQAKGIIKQLTLTRSADRVNCCVYLNFDRLELAEMSAPEQTIALKTKSEVTLPCEIHSMEIITKSLEAMMPGLQIAFEGILCLDNEDFRLIVTSIIASHGTSCP